MRIRVIGSLVIKQVRGANGKFCADDHHRERGILKVKDPDINQLTELADLCAFSGGSGHVR
jgi:hypothetical protein